jgi:hypothetical protein
MNPPPPRTNNYDNLAPRANSTRNIQTSEKAEASGTMVTQTPDDWRLPKPNWGSVGVFR